MLSVMLHDAVKSGLQIPLPLNTQKHLHHFFRHFSFRSDSNSYFPVGPCEYGGPLQALMAGDANAGGFSSSYCPRSTEKLVVIMMTFKPLPMLVFLLDEPEKIPRHNIYELVWFLKTGMTRMKRMMLGLEPFVYDFGILTEGYQHYTP